MMSPLPQRVGFRWTTWGTGAVRRRPPAWLRRLYCAIGSHYCEIDAPISDAQPVKWTRCDDCHAPTSW